MAVMSSGDRLESFAEAMRNPPPGVTFNVSKSVLQALHDDCDFVLDAHVASMNTDIQARNANWNTLSNATKKFILVHIFRKRFDKGA